MAAEDLRINWGAWVDPIVTNLQSLDDAEVWQSGEISDAEPSNMLLEIAAKLVGDSNVADGDECIVRIARGDNESSELWDAGIGTTEGVITTAATVAKVQTSCPLVLPVKFTGASETQIKHAVIPAPSDYFQILVEGVFGGTGQLASSANVIRYRLGTPQRQTS